MDQQSLKKSIESGEYFIEARKWYNNMFLFPIRYNSFMLGISLSIIIVLFFTFHSLYNIFPLSETVQVVVPLNNTLDFVPMLKNISEPGKSTKQVVLEYLATKYIQARETYDPATFKANYYYILRSTDKKLFNDYYENISNAGEQSPALLYKKGLRSKIEVISETYDANNNFIAVNFVKQNYNLLTGENSVQQFEAKIQFLVSDYNFAESENARLNFIVTGYEISEIKS